MIITRPNHDFATKYLFRWSQTVITLAKKRKILVIDLKGRRVSRVELTKSVKKNAADFIFINGHGNDDLVTGYNNQILVQFNDNEKLFSGKIVYARSCRSAANQRLENSSVSEKDRELIPYLQWNMEKQVCLGNKNARLKR